LMVQSQPPPSKGKSQRQNKRDCVIVWLYADIQLFLFSGMVWSSSCFEQCEKSKKWTCSWSVRAERWMWHRYVILFYCHPRYNMGCRDSDLQASQKESMTHSWEYAKWDGHEYTALNRRRIRWQKTYNMKREQVQWTKEAVVHPPPMLHISFRIFFASRASIFRYWIRLKAYRRSPWPWYHTGLEGTEIIEGILNE
jgi:hypothetical protein